MNLVVIGTKNIKISAQANGADPYQTGPSCSKLTTLLVNVFVKFSDVSF